MENLWTLASVLGGIGLFLLGMWLMTEGLKVAAGPALETILERRTRTPLRGIAAGFVVTGVVQSSSAVTVATIGFVNAGLLTLQQSAWVLYGANLGTTMTSWLVVLAGSTLKIDALALPLIGGGMLLRVMRPNLRLGSWGQAAAGFGIFFLGIGVLKDAFAASALMTETLAVASDDWQSILLFVGIGIALAVLTQSSSATIAIALTALAGGAIALEPAAAMVIGANVGTTTTALLATIGATSNAKRVAVIHVIFNLLTGCVALAILLAAMVALDAPARPAPSLTTATIHLALFHTGFKVLGVAIMWPVTNGLVRFTARLFLSRSETEGRPFYLDANVLAVPQLAAHGVFMETRRLGSMALRHAIAAIDSGGSGHTNGAEPMRVLARSIQQFVTEMNRSRAAGEAVQQLPHALRAIQHYQEIAALSQRRALGGPAAPADVPGLAMQIANYRAAILHALHVSDATRGNANIAAADQAWHEVDSAYQTLKAELLAAAARGETGIERVDDALEAIAIWRRIAYCAVRGLRRLTTDAEAIPDPKQRAPATPLVPPAGEVEQQ